MKLPLLLSLLLGLLCSGCQSFRKSATWEKVRDFQPEGLPAAGDASSAYAAQLHTLLASRGVEHKIVTYQFRYGTRMRDESTSTQTAVIYKDGTDPTYPWWLAEERTRRPVWLPNDEVGKQVSFYLRRHAEVVELRAYPGGGDGKEMAGPQDCHASDSGTAEARLPALFRKMNGTDFDPASALDRQKMAALKAAR